MTAASVSQSSQARVGNSPHPLADRARYKVWSTDRLRVTDLDHQYHVNNAVFAVLYTSGRHDFIRSHVRPLVAESDVFTMARITIEYLAEMHYPGDVEVGTLIRRLGRTSITFGHGMFKDGKCVSVADAVMVLLDSATRRTKPLPPDAAITLARFVDARD